MHSKWSKFMTAWLLLCSFLIAVESSSAQTAAAPTPAATQVTEVVIETAPSNKADIIIYGGSGAQVEETRTLQSLNKGLNKVRLSGISKQYLETSLRVFPPPGLKVKSSTYQESNLTSERLLAESIGRYVRVTGKYGNAVAGQLKGVSGGQLIVETATGLAIVYPSDSIEFTEGPDGEQGAPQTKLSNTASLILEVYAEKDGNYPLKFLYETGGLSYQVDHSLFFEPKGDFLESMETSVSIVNHSGTTFKEATVYLMSGNAIRAGGGRAYLKSGPMAPGGGLEASRMADESVAQVSDLQDQKRVKIPGAVELGEGTRQVRLWDFKEVPVRKEYFIPHGAVGEGFVFVRLELDNCEKSHMGEPLPAGSVKIYQTTREESKEGTKEGHTLIHSTDIGHHAEGEKFKLDMPSSKDLKFKKTMTYALSDGPDPKDKAPERRVFQEHSYTVDIESYKKEQDATVTIEVYVSLKQNLLKPLIVKSANEAFVEITVAKMGKGTTSYKVKELGYR